MKTIIASFLLVFMSTSILAQDSANPVEHLKFKGIPIDGSLNEFVTKIEKKGFKFTGLEDGVTTLKGDFAGYKNCILAIPTYGSKTLVSKVVVLFPDNYTWAELSSDYYLFKELLTKKYGKPTEIVEEFETNIEPKDDNSKMLEVIRDNCKYYATYELENGTIQLSIEKNGFLSGAVVLIYFDKINIEKIRQKALDDL